MPTLTFDFPLLDPRCQPQRFPNSLSRIALPLAHHVHCAGAVFSKMSIEADHEGPINVYLKKKFKPKHAIVSAGCANPMLIFSLSFFDLLLPFLLSRLRPSWRFSSCCLHLRSSGFAHFPSCPFRCLLTTLALLLKDKAKNEAYTQNYNLKGAKVSDGAAGNSDVKAKEKFVLSVTAGSFFYSRSSLLILILYILMTRWFDPHHPVP